MRSRKKYPSLLVLDDDVAAAFAFVCDVMEAEAEAIKSAAPYAITSMNRVELTAVTVHEISLDAENERFSEV